MTEEDEKYYENFFELVATKGWEQLVAVSQQEANSFDISGVKDIEDLRIKQGKLQVLDNIINFADIIRNTYDTIKAEEAYES